MGDSRIGDRTRRGTHIVLGAQIDEGVDADGARIEDIVGCQDKDALGVDEQNGLMVLRPGLVRH